MSRTVWTVLGVIVAVIVAWFLVDLLFSLLWFIGKLAIVAVVAVIVFFVLRALVRPSDDRREIER
ncbi:hypothetical protein [Agromyces mariniharenae]|uniref:Major facilitator superfamily (MFS) profile domain-containing protein n=1 Tax=Agromyces mariniharenae TaxID=2604423 RepID=A0A5S4V1I1_9MICO|nr:hypothetical protein [Agromyces mariniharenae]TYL52776.1 hypothetical protein FYC51_03255 [Agromyces mariniharenae]HEU0180903.1 hypothetical protein [Agromyces mariniharenae]